MVVTSQPGRRRHASSIASIAHPVCHGQADLGQRHEPEGRQLELNDLPGELYALGHMPQGSIQFVAGEEHLGDPYVRLASMKWQEPAALRSEPQTFPVGA
jgi:hypothetical protein